MKNRVTHPSVRKINTVTTYIDDVWNSEDDDVKILWNQIDAYAAKNSGYRYKESNIGMIGLSDDPALFFESKDLWRIVNKVIAESSDAKRNVLKHWINGINKKLS